MSFRSQIQTTFKVIEREFVQFMHPCLSGQGVRYRDSINLENTPGVTAFYWGGTLKKLDRPSLAIYFLKGAI